MKVVRHQHVGDEFAWPFSAQGVEFIEESHAKTWVGKDLYAIKNVASDKVQRARKIQIGPFLGHDGSENPLESKEIIPHLTGKEGWLAAACAKEAAASQPS